MKLKDGANDWSMIKPYNNNTASRLSDQSHKANSFRVAAWNDMDSLTVVNNFITFFHYYYVVSFSFSYHLVALQLFFNFFFTLLMKLSLIFFIVLSNLQCPDRVSAWCLNNILVLPSSRCHLPFCCTFIHSSSGEPRLSL